MHIEENRLKVPQQMIHFVLISRSNKDFLNKVLWQKFLNHDGQHVRYNDKNLNCWQEQWDTSSPTFFIKLDSFSKMLMVLIDLEIHHFISMSCSALLNSKKWTKISLMFSVLMVICLMPHGRSWEIAFVKKGFVKCSKLLIQWGLALMRCTMSATKLVC